MEPFRKYLNTDKIGTNIKELLMSAGKLGDKLGYSVYIVGGFVRDLLLNISSNDIDIVVEGDGIKFGKILAQIHNESFTSFKNFGTGYFYYHNIKVDIITARKEYYEYPAALPMVEFSSIKDDLNRRDFTINTLAIKLNQKEYGKLIDYFSGLEDLKNKKIKILHGLSFIDDPTRIFRAIKFEQRLCFNMESHTKVLLIKAIEDGLLKKLSNERRVNQILELLSEECSYKAIKRAFYLKVFDKLFNYIKFDCKTISSLENADRYHDKIKSRFKLKTVDKSIIKVLILFSDCDKRNIDKLINDLPLNKDYVSCLKIFLENKENVFIKLSNRLISDVSIYNILTPLGTDIILSYYYMATNNEIKIKIDHYMKNLRHINILITGKDLIKLNIKPGKIYNYLFKNLLEAKIKGIISTYDEELNYVKKIYNIFKSKNKM